MTIESGLGPGPTVQLPPAKKIAFLPLNVLEESLIYLREIYSPPVRGSRLVSRQKLFPPSQSRSSPIAVRLPDESPWDHIRHDKFERSHAIRWLTSLISQLQLDDSGSFVDEKRRIREAIVEDAASLLALCAGTASAGTLTRTFMFESGLLSVQITDMPLQNYDFSTIGAQTWGGACVLAETMVSNPHEFGLDRDLSVPLRVLELGAGTGLVSIVLAQYLSRRSHTSASIYSTDFNAPVLANLGNNITVNSCSLSTAVSLTSAFLDWSQPDSCDRCLPDSFDLILGADIVYEMDHILWIKSCLSRLLRRPRRSESYTPRFHLIVPLRPTYALESNAIEQIFPFVQASPSRGGVAELAIISKDIIACDASEDEKVEVEYVYYVIGWEVRDWI